MDALSRWYSETCLIRRRKRGNYVVLTGIVSPAKPAQTLLNGLSSATARQCTSLRVLSGSVSRVEVEQLKL